MPSLRPFLVLALVASPAWATTLVALDVEGLARTSDVVVRGHVLKSEPRLTKDGARIVTDTEIEVAETHKGAPGRTVTVMQPGGVVGEVGQKVDGVAPFEPGEEVVVFLEQRGTRYLVTGMVQGKWRVERSGGQVLARPETTGEALLLDEKTRQPVARHTEPLPLATLAARVKATLPTVPASTPTTPVTPKVPAP